MRKHKHPLLQTGFLGFLGTQFLGAFNDNVFKMLVICAAAATLSAEAKKDYIPLASAFFILPYLLFSAFAGYLADRYSKRSVMIATKFAEIAIMCAGALLFWRLAVYPLLAVLFLMGAQSAFFSPAKYGFLPETLSEKHLPSGNGATQLFTFLAIILGGWAGSAMADSCGGNYLIPALVTIAIAVVGTISSFAITRTRLGSRKVKPSFDPLTPHWKTFLELRKDPVLLYCFLGNTFFWFLGALFQSNIPFIVQDELKQSDTMIGYLQAAVALGIGIGSALAGYASKGKIAYRFIIPSGILLSLAAFAFGLAAHSTFLVIILTALLGIAGGFFQIPLTTAIQHRSPQDKRGRYLAAGNALDSISMLLSAAVHWIFLKPLNLSPANVIVALGAIIAIVIAAMWKWMPKEIDTRQKLKLISIPRNTRK
ncbi:MAG: MFS transporter [Lentisphaerae bacterium]|jgi:acyl-[acyl-carrier-protein]-phospholipid O-acyltransferase/long-chain-fatty-acid--[acyl-carrier-protein] ligase|nr:MFS transporter [Lentisphaerota bacterium]